MAIQQFGKWDLRGVSDHALRRAEEYYTSGSRPARAERAASVILLREAPLRVYMMRHVTGGPFADSKTATVVNRYGFPSGIHKPDDADVASTGVREVEEETGSMVALQRAWARWLTPEYEPDRYDVWIYVATLAEGFQPRANPREPEYATWLGPEQAVCQYGGQMSMPEATALAELSNFTTVGEVFAAAEQRPMEPLLPRLNYNFDPPRLLLPGEENYPEYATTIAEATSGW
ncbi:NUDIX domain-containing protein [Haloglycomyces albus]|uniref:NUDIX domain-containing protein n=1 Tax=Haloglycomyces albus TaxID=526067 RepID=UPI00046D2E7E|nr:NUDIX domain-containing protein [Haloglycomyces albus]